MTNFLAIVVAIASVLFAPVVVGDCDGYQDPDLITKLDFSNATVATNTLHEAGGELRFANIGEADNQAVDLVIKVDSGEYIDIVRLWEIQNKTVPNGNGINGYFGVINFQTEHNVGRPESGRGDFEACYVATGTDVPVTVKQFVWSVYDLDNRAVDALSKPVNKRYKDKEQLIIDVSQTTGYSLWPNSQVIVGCEDQSTPPCSNGVKTVFRSSEKGTGPDNPSDPENLTTLQKERSVAFTFQDTACWKFAYHHYCPPEQSDFTGPGADTTCPGAVAGGNMLFAGDSPQLTTSGTCYTPAPTVSASPSVSPTNYPSRNPSDQPSMLPSESPSMIPTNSPTTEPSTLPSLRPSLFPSGVPSTRPSFSPSTGEPSTQPSLRPSLFPSGVPSTRPSFSPSIFPSTWPSSLPSKEPSGSPSTLPSFHPSLRPSGSPSEQPSGSPTDVPSTAPSQTPSRIPSIEPSSLPSASPSFSPSAPPCREDVVLFHTDGATPIDLGESIRVVAQDTTTVTVRLHNAWTTESDTIDDISVQYLEDYTNGECQTSDDVSGTSHFGGDITIQCTQATKVGLMRICLSDQNNLDSNNDNANPECCSPNDQTDPTVCYSIYVHCETQCSNDTNNNRQRTLRSLLRNASDSIHSDNNELYEEDQQRQHFFGLFSN